MTLSLNGTNGIEFPDGTDQDAAAVGFGQTWQSVARSGGVVYTNSTGRPIVVRAFSSVAGASIDISLTVGGLIVEYCRFSVAGNTGRCSVSAVVPDGTTYEYTIGAGSFAFVELR